MEVWQYAAAVAVILLASVSLTLKALS